MAYARRNTSEDIRANRSWTADAPADLASIPAKHGDTAFEDTNNHAYIYVDGSGWVNLSATYGTWTPAITFGGGSTGITYTTQSGTYAKIGRLVHAECYITLSSKGSSTGDFAFSGLPFASSNVTPSGGGAVSISVNMSSLTSAMSVHVLANDTAGAIYDTTATGSVKISDANFNNTSTIVFSVTYIAAS